MRSGIIYFQEVVAKYTIIKTNMRMINSRIYNNLEST